MQDNSLHIQFQDHKHSLMEVTPSDSYKTPMSNMGGLRKIKYKGSE